MINEDIENFETMFPSLSHNDHKLVELIIKLEGYEDRRSLILLGRAHECLIKMRNGLNSTIKCNCGTLIKVPQNTHPKQWGCPDCSTQFFFPASIFGALTPKFIAAVLPLPDSDAILCLDFGTSSLKAAIKKHHNSLAESLNLGMHAATDGLYNEDQSSIPSAIFISKSDNSIYFGQEALLRGQRGETSELFEISPKKWLTELTPDDINQPIIGGVSRKNFLSGLISVALESSMAQGAFDIQELLAMELRLSHPVWPTGLSSAKLNAILKEIADEAVNLAYLKSVSSLDPIKNIGEFKQRIVTSLIDHRSSRVDVEEPIAAAIELFENANNSREVCVIIDVGAGTTDIGLFESVTPDIERNLRFYQEPLRRKIIPLKPPVSIYQAGDFIDQELINSIKEASPVALNAAQLGEINSRRRQIKETLFNSGQVVEFGINVRLDDLVNRDGIKLFCESIKQNFINQIIASQKTIHDLFNATIDPIKKIDVIFAGGGANIGFLNTVIKNTELEIMGYKVPIALRKPTARKYSNLKAPIERLAVSLGGTLDAEQWPKTKMGDTPMADPLGYITPTYIHYP